MALGDHLGSDQDVDPPVAQVLQDRFGVSPTRRCVAIEASQARLGKAASNLLFEAFRADQGRWPDVADLDGLWSEGVSYEMVDGGYRVVVDIDGVRIEYDSGAGFRTSPPDSPGPSLTLRRRDRGGPRWGGDADLPI